MKILVASLLMMYSSADEYNKNLYNQINFLLEKERITIVEAQKLWIENKVK